MIELHDPLYGEVSLADPLLYDLLQSTAVQRLKGISMGGISALVGFGPPETRYQHSVGAMLLVRRLGGTILEQAAALLHDVSHTALSHVVDFVLDTPSRQAFHDDKKAWFIARTDIPAICAAHGVEWRALIDESRWPLLEQEAPRLCADRIDYTLRDALHLAALTLAGARSLVCALRSHEGRPVFDSIEAARNFARAYLACDKACWSHATGIGLYVHAARAVKLALERGTVEVEGLWVSDAELWAKVGAFADVTAETRFERHPDGDIKVRPKVRSVDPCVLIDGVASPLGTLDAAWADERGAYLASKAGEWTLRRR